MCRCGKLNVALSPAAWMLACTASSATTARCPTRGPDAGHAADRGRSHRLLHPDLGGQAGQSYVQQRPDAEPPGTAAPVPRTTARSTAARAPGWRRAASTTTGPMSAAGSTRAGTRTPTRSSAARAARCGSTAAPRGDQRACLPPMAMSAGQCQRGQAEPDRRGGGERVERGDDPSGRRHGGRRGHGDDRHGALDGAAKVVKTDLGTLALSGVNTTPGHGGQQRHGGYPGREPGRGFGRAVAGRRHAGGDRELRHGRAITVGLGGGGINVAASTSFGVTSAIGGRAR